MYLPPNPLKGNREKFDNEPISRKSKVAVCQIIQNPKLGTRN